MIHMFAAVSKINRVGESVGESWDVHFSECSARERLDAENLLVDEVDVAPERVGRGSVGGCDVGEGLRRRKSL